VEGGDERNIELVLEAVSGDPAQPVVAVDHVDAARLRDVVPHAVGEDVDELGQLLLGHVVRAGLDVGDRVARFDEDLVRQTRPVGARVRRALDAGLGERRRDLAHIDVHAATVPRTWLHQRRRVE
jgi:hypothetical protein